VSTVTVRWRDGDELRSGGVQDIEAAVASDQAWIDIYQPDRQTLDAVCRHVSLHPLAVDDALEAYQRPKIDLYWDIVYLIWVMPALLPDDGLDMRKLDVFLGEKVLVTAHRELWPSIDVAAEEAASGLKRGVEWILHGILDGAVDEVFPIVDSLSDDLESLEDRMLERAAPELLEQLYATKRLLIALRRIVGPERDVLRGLARQEALVSQEAYAYFQDVGDHLARVEDTVDTYRDVAGGIMDIYLSSVSNRLNGVMKQLTVVATVFMPLTLITGIYGMNFRQMPELGSRYGYPAVLVGMATIAFGMMVYFKRRNWW